MTDKVADDDYYKVIPWIASSKLSDQKYRISEWAEFQVWKFLHLQKLAHGKKSLPPKGRRPAGGKAFLPTG